LSFLAAERLTFYLVVERSFTAFSGVGDVGTGRSSLTGIAVRLAVTTADGQVLLGTNLGSSAAGAKEVPCAADGSVGAIAPIAVATNEAREAAADWRI
jgi:hypothetical protein